MSNPEVEGTPVETPAEEPWYAQVSQEDFEAMRETTEQVRQALAQQQQQPQEQYDPDDYLTVAQAQQLIQQATQPFQQFTQQAATEEAMERAKDIVSSYATEKQYDLDDNLTDLILARADAYLPQATAKYGQGNRAAEAALAEAADAVMNTITERNKAYYEQQMNQLNRRNFAPQELPASRQAAPQLTPGQAGGTIADIVAAYNNS